ncbi:polysaccharide pyruvyl transferase family protein [Kineococcus sp. G2]|uniref:polysaccharide pyruvyl transferase family protein n=1 Tax=Kineococcus sp. G2 TaxID=3127484 RepID=UPI00301B9B3E
MTDRSVDQERESTGEGTAALGETVPALRRRLLSDLREALPEHPSWTALDFPMHLNCGDSALHLGLEAAAAERGVRVRRVLDRRSYRPELLDPDSLPVSMAGGTWGGLYPTHHELRLRFLRDTRGRDAVQLPQSIEHVDEEHREQLRRAVGEHGRFTFLVRDRRSYEIAVRDYDCEVRLVPDLAFALGPLPRRPATRPLAVQARTDREAGRVEGFEETFDWITAPPRSRSALLLRLATRLNAQQRRSAAPPVALAARTAMRALARANLDRACSMLSAGERVVTDRLHGHVISTLLGIPHVVVNDRFGKVRALYETWTAPDPVSRFAASWAQVPAALAQLEHPAPGPVPPGGPR